MLSNLDGRYMDASRKVVLGHVYLRPRGVCEYLKIARSTLHNWVKHRHGFPQPVKAGPGVTLFDQAEIDAYMAALK